MNVQENQFQDLLTQFKKITVVGISPNPARPSHQIAIYLKTHGYEVVGVNPGHEEIAGIKVYKSLTEVPREYRRFVDVFRSSDSIPELVEEILKIGETEVLWLQLGVTHSEAEKKAEKNGIQVISNYCILVEHRKYLAK